jgi:hypothetical protein
MRDKVKDDGLAAEVAEIEHRFADDPRASRREIRAAVEESYTLPAAASDGAPSASSRPEGPRIGA